MTFKMDFKQIEEQKIELLLIFLVLILAASLRFYNIQNIGLRNTDEGGHLIAGRCLIEPNFVNCDVAWQPFVLNKPLNDIFNSLSLLVFGFHDYVGIILSAILGTITVLITFLIGKNLYNWRAGIIAALILALMNYHVIFSRMALSEINSLFFVSLSILFYVLAKKTQKRIYLLLTGIVFGLSFGVRYDATVLLFVFLFIELFHIILDFNSKNLFEIEYLRNKILFSMKNFLVILGGFSIVFFIIWFLYWLRGLPFLSLILGHVNMWGLGRNVINTIPILNTIPRFSPFLQYHFTARGFIEFARSLIIYTYYLYRLVTPIVLFSVFLAFFLFIYMKKNRKFDLIPLVWFFLLFLLFVHMGHNAPRHIIITLPALALLSARGLDIINISFFCNFYKKYKINPNKIFILIVLIIFVLSFISTIPYLNDTFQVHSESAKYLEGVGATRIFSNNPPLTGWYFQGKVVRISNISELNKNAILSKNINYILIDSSKLDKDDIFLLKVQEECEPIKVIPIEQEEWRFLTPENWEYNLSLSILNKISPKLADDLRERLAYQAQKEYLRIYDIESCGYFIE